MLEYTWYEITIQPLTVHETMINSIGHCIPFIQPPSSTFQQNNGHFTYNLHHSLALLLLPTRPRVNTEAGRRLQNCSGRFGSINHGSRPKPKRVSDPGTTTWVRERERYFSLPGKHERTVEDFRNLLEALGRVDFFGGLVKFFGSSWR